MIEQLTAYARQLANEIRFELHIEHSHPTEAVYLRVFREGYWWGLRIATHPPAYACSADFAQLLLPAFDLNEVWVEDARSIVAEFISHGGAIVADPQEVQQAIEQAFLGCRRERHRLPTTTEICNIRHRLNFRARWIFDEEQTLKAQG